MTLLEAETLRANAADGWIDPMLAPPPLGVRVEVFGLISTFFGGIWPVNLGVGFLTKNTDSITSGWKVDGRSWWRGNCDYTVTKWRPIQHKLGLDASLENRTNVRLSPLKAFAKKLFLC